MRLLKFRYNSVEFTLTICFVLFSLIEIITEFYNFPLLHKIVKPLLLPILLWIYLLNTKVNSKTYIFGLVFSWLANIFFMLSYPGFIDLATYFFALSRILILFKVYYEVKFPSIFPLIIGTIPFLFLFAYFNMLIIENIGLNTMIFILFQSIIISIYGGLALGNYIIKNDNISMLLLVSALFFFLNIFLLGIMFYHLNLKLLKPTAMVFFLAGHYVLLKFVLFSEKETDN